MRKWRRYLQTDQYSLKFLCDQREIPTQCTKWLAKFIGQQFTVEYREDKTNKAVNGLSWVSKSEETEMELLDYVDIIYFIENIFSIKYIII